MCKTLLQQNDDINCHLDSTTTLEPEGENLKWELLMIAQQTLWCIVLWELNAKTELILAYMVRTHPYLSF